MIVILGSINLDIAFSVERLPGPGETLLAQSYLSSPGGKGANQACAAARSGAKTAFFGKVGNDSFAPAAMAGLKAAKVDLAGIETASVGTGCATICVDPKAENAIVVGSSANQEVSHEQVPASLLTPDTWLLLQMEIPYEENWQIIRRARQAGCKILLNAAPAGPVSPEILDLLDYLIVNETEARQITGDGDGALHRLAAGLSERHALTVIITLGAEGVLSTGPDGEIRMPAWRVEAVDTTGAGDAFCGCLVAALDSGQALREALNFAAAGAALSCTRFGAQSGQADRAEILSLLSP